VSRFSTDNETVPNPGAWDLLTSVDFNPGPQLNLQTPLANGSTTKLYQGYQMASWVHQNHYFKVGGQVVSHNLLTFPEERALGSFSLQGFINGNVAFTVPVDGLTSVLSPRSSGAFSRGPIVAPKNWPWRYTDGALFFQD